MGCFAISGIFVRSYFMAAYHASGSVGDHRLHVIDFCAVSILEAELPAVTKQKGRRLQYKLRSTRRKYRRDLVKICKQHKNGGEVTCDDASRELLDRDSTTMQGRVLTDNTKNSRLRVRRSAGNSGLADQSTHHC